MRNFLHHVTRKSYCDDDHKNLEYVETVLYETFYPFYMNFFLSGSLICRIMIKETFNCNSCMDNCYLVSTIESGPISLCVKGPYSFL